MCFEMEFNSRKRNHEENEKYLDWDIPNPTNFEDLLLASEIPDHNTYLIVSYWNSCYQITYGVIKNGYNFVKIKEDPLKEMYKFLAKIENYRITKQHLICKYPLTESFDLFSIDTLIFLCQCNMIAILYEADTSNFESKFLLTETDYNSLLAQELLLYTYNVKKVEDYSQTDIELSVYRLCQAWGNAELSTELEKYVNTICWKVCTIIYKGQQDFVDSIKERFQVFRELKVPDKEFFSYVASSTINMKIPFFIQRHLTSNEIQTIQTKKICEGKNVDRVYQALIVLLKNSIIYWNSETCRKVIKNLTYFLYLRPGEEAKYARFNHGTYIQEPSEILDHLRTDYQNFMVYSKMIEIEKNLPLFLDTSLPFYSRDERNGFTTPVKNATLFKVFEHMIQMECKIDWIKNCFLLERDFSRCYANIQQVVYPVILQMAGEFNIIFEGLLYKTMTAELAIVAWLIIVLYRLDCKLWIKNTCYDLANIRNSLEKEMQKQQQKPEDEYVYSFTNKNEEIIMS